MRAMDTFPNPSDKLVHPAFRTIFKKNNSKAVLVREYWVSRCAYGFHSLNLSQFQLQLHWEITKETKQWFSAVKNFRSIACTKFSKSMINDYKVSVVLIY